MLRPSDGHIGRSRITNAEAKALIARRLWPKFLRAPLCRGSDIDRRVKRFVIHPDSFQRVKRSVRRLRNDNGERLSEIKRHFIRQHRLRLTDRGIA